MYPCLTDGVERMTVCQLVCRGTATGTKLFKLSSSWYNPEQGCLAEFIILQSYVRVCLKLHSDWIHFCRRGGFNIISGAPQGSLWCPGSRFWHFKPISVTFCKVDDMWYSNSKEMLNGQSGAMWGSESCSRTQGQKELMTEPQTL